MPWVLTTPPEVLWKIKHYHGMVYCVVDPCSGIRCPEITCSSGKKWKPEGKCCPECTGNVHFRLKLHCVVVVNSSHFLSADPCLTLRCPEFTKCATNEYKTTGWCEETCDKNGKCAEDEVCKIVTDSTVPEECRKKSICKTTHHCKGKCYIH